MPFTEFKDREIGISFHFGMNLRHVQTISIGQSQLIDLGTTHHHSLICTLYQADVFGQPDSILQRTNNFYAIRMKLRVSADHYICPAGQRPAN